MSPVSISVTTSGAESLRRQLAQLGDDLERGAVFDSLLEIGFEIQTNAAQSQIIRSSLGPVSPTRVTSRTGSLRRSIGVDWAKDRRKGDPAMPSGVSPLRVRVGSVLNYAGVHEVGGRVDRPTVTVAAHRRTVAFGRRIPGGFTVPAHTRRGGTSLYPARPYLKPALDKVTPRMAGIMSRRLQAALDRLV